jgi:uncharacterized membrane protein
MSDFALFAAVFLACVVEAVEATTIVLAAGSTRDWRSAVMGVLAGIVLLAVAVAVAGPAISLLPLDVLRLVVGGLLLVFGLQWMRKAILRASGYKPLHDEDLIYQKQVAAARNATTTPRFGVGDWYAFTLSFKGVVLEGLEVVFIVLTFGTNQHNLPLAAAAAGVAVVLVVILGIAVRGPLSRVPENTLKFIVGIMLTAFGVFWGAEGAGALWPGSDLSLLVLAPAIAAFALLLVLVLRARRVASERNATPASASPSPSVLVPSGGPDKAAATAPASVSSKSPAPALSSAQSTDAREGSAALRRLRSFGLFWYDFVIGDDWQIAAGVALALLITFAIGVVGGASWIVMPIAVLILLPYGVRRALRS